MLKTVKQQLQLLEIVLQIMHAQAIPNSITHNKRSNVFQLIAQMQQIAQTGLAWMVTATLQVVAQITLKKRPPVQRDVPKIHAQTDKSSKSLVHALTVTIIKRLVMMVNLV